LLFRVFTLAFDTAAGRFDDTPVRDYLADKDVAAVSEHFFTHDGRPYLAVVVHCHGIRAADERAADAKRASARGRDESWRDVLESDDWPLFNRLREWRGERARAAGIPSYVICNNRQLAEVVKRRPASLAALGEVDGFGDAKLKNYGRELLDLLAAAGQAPAAEEKAKPEPESKAEAKNGPA
jgi:superfamily II DNA helicase RecQ